MSIGDFKSVSLLLLAPDCKLSRYQTLRSDPTTILIEHQTLHHHPATVSKRESVAACRIHFYTIAHPRKQPVKRALDVRRGNAQSDVSTAILGSARVRRRTHRTTPTRTHNAHGANTERTRRRQDRLGESPQVCRGDRLDAEAPRGIPTPPTGTSTVIQGGDIRRGDCIRVAQLGHGFQRQMTPGDSPLIVLFDQDGADQAHDGSVVGKQARRRHF